MTEVLVAIIVAVVGPTVLLIVQRRSNGRLADKIGEPNGHGSLVAMVQSVLSGQADQDGRLAAIEHRQTVTESHVQSLAGRMADVEKSIVSEIKEAAR